MQKVSLSNTFLDKFQEMIPKELIHMKQRGLLTLFLANLFSKYLLVVSNSFQTFFNESALCSNIIPSMCLA